MARIFIRPLLKAAARWRLSCQVAVLCKPAPALGCQDGDRPLLHLPDRLRPAPALVYEPAAAWGSRMPTVTTEPLLPAAGLPEDKMLWAAP